MWSICFFDQSQCFNLSKYFTCGFKILVFFPGDVYLIGCTNVGKSTLFNSLLKSDFCKVQAAELIQRATTSVWPGTTLNLLKFPITKFTAARMEEREKRLKELKQLEDKEKELKKAALIESGYKAKYATLSGRIERTYRPKEPEHLALDSFTSQGILNI